MEKKETNIDKDLSSEIEKPKNTEKIGFSIVVALFFSISFFTLLCTSLILDSFITYDKMAGFWSTLLIFIGRPWQFISNIACIISIIIFLKSKIKKTLFIVLIAINIIINIISTSVIISRVNGGAAGYTNSKFLSYFFII